jgi:hypothetical protein
MNRPCVLYDRTCIGCGECDRCDLNPDKICDNCMQCLSAEADYRGVLIDEIRWGSTGDSEQKPQDSDESFLFSD